MSAKKKRAEEHEEHENHERWLISYADMITLLAALFIVLFAMSRLDIMKFEKFARALGASLKGSSGGPASVIDSGSNGVGSGGDGFFDGIAPSKTGSASVEQALIEQQQQEEAGRLERQSFEVTKEQILTALRSVGLESKVTLKIDERGLVVNIVTDEVLFASGSAELRPQGRAVLDGLAPALRNLANHMSIAGHTDDVPISGTFASNWELSADARCLGLALPRRDTRRPAEPNAGRRPRRSGTPGPQ